MATTFIQSKLKSDIKAEIKKIDWEALKIPETTEIGKFNSEKEWSNYHHNDIKLIYHILNIRKGKHFLAQLTEEDVYNLCYVFSSRKKFSI